MPELSTDLVTVAPAAQVWDVLGRRFDRIGDWATAIPTSTAIPAARPASGTPAAGGPALPVAAAAIDAPVAGRGPAASRRPAWAGCTPSLHRW